MSGLVATAQQRRRAATHAALGEPVRLAIADLLAAGDQSPKDLAHSFGLATNLLAHHLGVMEDAGLVRRRRSEGDGRRTYVQLRFDHPMVAALASAAPLPATRRSRRIVFVCTANSARSQLAAAQWQHLSPIPATSAGTHPAPRVHPGAVAVATRHGLALGEHGTTHVDDVVRRGDLLVAVCDQAHEELTAAGSPATLHWSVPDPVRIGTRSAFEAAFADISTRVKRLTPAFPASV